MKNKTSRLVDELLMNENVMSVNTTENNVSNVSSMVDITESILNAVNENESNQVKKKKPKAEKAEKAEKATPKKNLVEVSEILSKANKYGYEIWVKDNEFNTKNITSSKSFVVINTKMNRYSSFNSYNDMIPNNDNVLNEKYEFDSKNTYEKKIAALLKKKYTKI